MFQSSSTRSSKHSTLSGDRIEDDGIDKLTNQIIKELYPIEIAVKNDKVGSLSDSKANKTDEISAKSKNIKNCQRPKNFAKTR